MIAASVEAAYRAGRIACADAKRKSENPHPTDSAEHAYWNRGWNEEYATLPPALQALRQEKSAAGSAS